jgi:hypothetical protein
MTESGQVFPAGAQSPHRAGIGVQIYALKLLDFPAPMFRRQVPTKQISQATKPFSVFEQTSGNSHWLSVTHEMAHSASARKRRQPMRTISFILGFAFILAGPSIAGSSEGSLPGIGTFSYSGSPAVTAAN